VAIFVLVLMQAMWVPTLGHANVLSAVHQHWFGERMHGSRQIRIDRPELVFDYPEDRGAKSTLLRIRNFGMPRHLIPRWNITIA
jgi:hypothetical protein